MNTKTTQTKNSAPKAATKPSAKTKTGKTTKPVPKAPHSAPVPPETAPDALQSEMPIRQEAPPMLATTDSVDSMADSTDASPSVQGNEMDGHVDVTPDESETIADESISLPSQTTHEGDATPEAADESPDADTDANSPAAEAVGAANESNEDAADISPTDEDAEPDEVENTAEKIAISEDALTETSASPKKPKGTERQLKSVSPRYASACQEVSRLRKAFLNALNEKAALLGIKRVGEAVPVRSDEMDALNAEIRDARQKLDDLLERKRQLKGSSPELEAVNQRIRELSRQRNAARVVKQSIYDEEMAQQSAPVLETNAAV